MRRTLLKNLIALALLAACSSDSAGPAAVASLAGMDVSLAIPTLGIGQTTQALAVLRDASGHSITVSGGDSVSWTSSTPAVATITPSTGMITAVSSGSTLISATAGGKTASATLTVAGNGPSGSVSAVRLSMAATAIGFGQSLPATATVLDAAGNVTTAHPISWTSSSTNVALVSQAGMVTGLSAGTSTISATSEGVAGTLLVTVGAVPVNSIVVELTPGSVTVNGSSHAAATVKDIGGNTLTDSTVTWGTSNSDVATVAQDATVKGIASGLANITATVEGVTGSATIAVGNAPVANVATTLKPQIFVGEHAQAAAALTDASGATLTGRDIDWVSSNPSVASVGSDGSVTGVAAGTATITATSEGKSGAAPITVTAVVTLVPTTVNVSLSASTIGTTGNGTASAVVLDQAGNTMSGQTVTWSSSNTSVVTINPSTGAYTAAGTGSTTIRASVGSLSGTATLTVVSSGPTHLAFITQPGGAVSGVQLTSQPVVQLLDGSNSVVTSATANVTVSIFSGSGTLVGTKTLAAVSGVATFSDLKLNGASTDRLMFSSTGLTSAVSSSISVTQLPASLVMRRQPSDGASGTALATQPQVQVLDNAGLTYTGSSLAITASITSGSGTLGGTTTVNTFNGVATFSSLAVTGGGAFVLGFATTSPALNVSSNPINITAAAAPPPTAPAPPTKISITTQPAGSVSGSTLTTQPIVELRDATNTVTTSTANVTVSAAPGTISGTTTIAAVNGVATFTDLVVTGTGAQTLTFTSTGLTSATSTSFTLSAPVGPQATQLAVTRQPAGVVSGVTMTTQPTVELRTVSNAVATGATAAVTATLTGTGTLSGTTTVNAVNGVATFTNLKVSGGGQYSLTFASSGLTSAASSPFTSTQNAASLSVSTQPGGAVSGSAFATQPVVRILDNAGLLVASGSNSTLAITAARNSGSATLAGTTSATAVGGIATFTNLSFTGQGVGTHSLLFTATLAGISSTSSNFTVSAGAATRLSVTTQPATAVVGTAFGTQPVVQLLDANSNPTSSTAAVTAAIGGTTAGGTLAGTTSVAAVNGVATFTNLSIATASGSYSLAFSSNALIGATSSVFSVAAAGGGGGGTTGSTLLASADFEDGTYGSLLAETPGHLAIIADPTGAGHGKVMQVTFACGNTAPACIQPGTTRADLNQFASWNPTSGLSHGSTFRFSGQVYIPANTPHMTDGTLRKLLYFRTSASNEFDYVINMFGQDLGLEVAGPSQNDVRWSTGYTMPVGQWVSITVAITTNSAPGTKDGSTTIWVNGNQVLQKSGIAFTSSSDPTSTRWSWLAIGHQREGVDGDSTPISELRYWDNIAFSTP